MNIEEQQRELLETILAILKKTDQDIIIYLTI